MASSILPLGGSASRQPVLFVVSTDTLRDPPAGPCRSTELLDKCIGSQIWVIMKGGTLHLTAGRLTDIQARITDLAPASTLHLPAQNASSSESCWALTTTSVRRACIQSEDATLQSASS